MNLEIISAKKTIFKSDIVTSISLQTTSGYVSIYPGHQELITRISNGEIEVNTDRLSYFAVDDGIAYISNDNIKILVGFAISAEDIDEEASVKAKQDAEKMLQAPSLEASEIAYLEAVIARENTKINIAKLYRRR